MRIAKPHIPKKGKPTRASTFKVYQNVMDNLYDSETYNNHKFYISNGYISLKSLNFYFKQFNLKMPVVTQIKYSSPIKRALEELEMDLGKKAIRQEGSQTFIHPLIALRFFYTIERDFTLANAKWLLELALKDVDLESYHSYSLPNIYKVYHKSQRRAGDCYKALIEKIGDMPSLAEPIVAGIKLLKDSELGVEFGFDLYKIAESRTAPSSAMLEEAIS